MDISGRFYAKLKTLPNPFGPGRKYSIKDLGCIQRTFAGLTANNPTGSPGLLLGKIQSGKTKSFIGLIALCFDNGFDVVVVLTKNSEALTSQTVRRLVKEFRDFSDSIRIRDIKDGKGSLPPDLASKKLILVAKKQHTNLDYLSAALVGPASHLKGKKVLIIDDEADSASVSFSGGSRKDKEGRKLEAEFRKVAKKIDALRRELHPRPVFLQVTATPYSLLLQNKGAALKHDRSAQPLRPSFAELVPVHADYFGGDHYFGEISDDSSRAESLMHHSVSEAEMELLGTPNSFDLSSLAISGQQAHAPSLVASLVGFVVSGCIRRLQQETEGQAEKDLLNFAMLMHTEPGKQVHNWQVNVVAKIVGCLSSAAALPGSRDFDDLLRRTYDDLATSLALENKARKANKMAPFALPSFDSVKAKVKQTLAGGFPRVTIVNSDEDVSGLLDAESGELKLEAFLTVFVAGQYMDRGVTIPNLLAFFYGRSPKTFQQDTVLQHCRMFGFRFRPEVVVTRFYTTDRILAVLREMHVNDTILRQRIEKYGVSDDLLQILQTSATGGIKYCSFDKIRASRLRVVDATTKFWPRAFELKKAQELPAFTFKVDDMLSGLGVDPEKNGQVLVSAEQAISIIENVSAAFVGFAPAYAQAWLTQEIVQLVQRLSDPMAGRDRDHAGKVFIVVRPGRKRPNQFARNVTVLDSPDNPEEDTKPCHRLAKSAPVLLLTRQNGSTEDDWFGKPFWWPVFFPPFDEKCYMYAID